MQARTSTTIQTSPGVHRRAVRLTVPHAGNGYTALHKVLATGWLRRVEVTR
jgi:hypothetical protein